MDSQSEKKDLAINDRSNQADLKLDSVSFKEHVYKAESHKIEQLCDENLTTLQKIHAILLNCINLSKKQKLEFCESERYFMKLYLKKLQIKKTD